MNKSITLCFVVSWFLISCFLFLFRCSELGQSLVIIYFNYWLNPWGKKCTDYMRSSYGADLQLHENSLQKLWFCTSFILSSFSYPSLKYSGIKHRQDVGRDSGAPLHRLVTLIFPVIPGSYKNSLKILWLQDCPRSRKRLKWTKDVLLSHPFESLELALP